MTSCSYTSGKQKDGIWSKGDEFKNKVVINRHPRHTSRHQR